MKILARFPIGGILAVWLAFVTHPASARAGELSDGLPERLPYQALEKPELLPFLQDSTGPVAPFGAQVQVDGKTITHAQARALLFSEDFAASIPPGTQVQVSKNADGLEVWNYPTGTRVEHRIRWKASDAPVFELRVIEKLPNGRWAFGMYTPEEDAPASNSGALPKPLTPKKPDHDLVLNRYSGTPGQAFKLRPIGQPAEIQVNIRKLPLQHCQHCHFMHSPSGHQYETEDDTGPCGFAPANGENIRKGWAESWLKKFGASPLQSGSR
jgi:hypothetical protein